AAAGPGPSEMVTSAATPATFGRPVTFTVTIQSRAASVPTGTVTFRAGERDLGTKALDLAGQAQVTVADLAPGEHDVHAEYCGDAAAGPSLAATMPQVVQPNPPLPPS